MTTILEGGKDHYRVGGLVAEATKYRLYLCEQARSGRQCLLQIAKALDYNGGLDRGAFFLQLLSKRSDALELEYAEVVVDEKRRLNYDLGFPELVDTFICSEQGNRRVNILGFRFVDDLSRLSPLAVISTRDRLRVDLRTSAWMMGKLLKLLLFAHEEGVSIGRVGGDNILIEPDEHYVIFLDWSEARSHDGEVPSQLQRDEIAQAAQAVITALGGNLETGTFPNDGEDGFTRYTEHLLRLARGSERNARQAHTRFYQLIDELWERGFYPFTAHSNQRKGRK